jgi:hypothetical protein
MKGEWEYEGEHREGSRWGEGRCVMRHGTYLGQWERDMRKGQGRFVYVNDNVYEGSWNDDQQHGLGRLQFANKDVYEGAFQQGEITGQGRYTFSNGD